MRASKVPRLRSVPLSPLLTIILSTPEIQDYARFLGFDPETEPELLWIARQGLQAALPEVSDTFIILSLIP